MNDGIWLLLLLEPVSTYFRMRRGTKRYHKNLDFYDRNAQSAVKPSKLIQRHFDLGRNEMPVVIYRRYILTYIFFIRIFLLYIVACFLRFNVPRYCVAWCLITIVLILVALPTLIFNISVEHKSYKERRKNKKKEKKEESEKLIDELREAARSWREMKQFNAEIKAQKWIDPLTKELDRCTRKERGKVYLSWDAVAYAERRILRKYQKYACHELISDKQGNRNLSVYAKKDHRLIYQVDIKK